ncbi:alpha/beta hydrolase [Streptosporangium sp. NBC_01755]|uniref:alpha/beta hydrolase fold domain-containing protein n=1 Tax=unclassified Streptosporangium TaxID=2632669 RepID=UPI002DD8B13B|nr:MULTISPECIES: alpha/beta hydrolase fold domain-containing protein [unclassified Streptosporangium]WSA28130.1 alpha/beta hydrolase [Streptosporangium sp. NBC_01810]WSD00395.1 alpha/beta hydrolase [Streptosporangium sp. NBC_01755]
MRYEINTDVSPAYPFSWQAATLNAIMRGTFKPASQFLLRTDIGFVAASRIAALAGRVPLRLPVHVRVTPDEAGPCPGEWVRAGEELDERKVLLYFHGGGYFAGSPATHRPITWRLSAATRRPVLAVDYRQGPVHTPAEALADAIAAYRCLLEHGYHPADIVFGGDSAGGHLTLATLLALRDQDMPLPAAAVCLSPWTDLTDVPRRVNRTLDPMIPAGSVEWLARRWTAGLDPHDPLLSPVLGDYTGLPPLMVVTGSTEVLRDEGRRVAERARAAGVSVMYEEWPRMPHVFAILADVVPEAREVYPHIARFLDAAQDLLPDQEVAAQDLLARDVPDQGLAAQDLVASDLAVSDLPAPGLPGEDVSALRIPPVQSGSTAA